MDLGEKIWFPGIRADIWGSLDEPICEKLNYSVFAPLDDSIWVSLKVRLKRNLSTFLVTLLVNV